MKTLFVYKTGNPYSDLLLTLGLAHVMGNAFTRVNISDEGYRYTLNLHLYEEEEPEISYTDMIPFIQGKSTSKIWDDNEDNIFDIANEIEEQKEDLTRIFGSEFDYRVSDHRLNNALCLKTMRHDKNHNDLLQWARGVNFGILLPLLIEKFSIEDLNSDPIEATIKSYKEQTRNSLMDKQGKVKIYFPDAVLGVCEVKASPFVEPQKERALRLWLMAVGFFHYAISQRGEDYTWRVLLLNPRDILLFNYRGVIYELQDQLVLQYQFLKDEVNFDCHMILSVCKSTLSVCNRRCFDKFTGVSFVSKRKVYGVESTFGLSFPSWIGELPQNYAAQIIKELTNVNFSLKPPSPCIKNHFRDFLTTSNIKSFLDFMTEYGDYIVTKDAYPMSIASLDRLLPVLK